MTNQESGGPPSTPKDELLNGFSFDDTDSPLEWDFFIQQFQIERTEEQLQHLVGAQPSPDEPLPTNNPSTEFPGSNNLYPQHDTQPASTRESKLSSQVATTRARSSVSSPPILASPEVSTSPSPRRSKRRRSSEEARLVVKRSMGDNGTRSYKCPCPIFQAEMDRGLPHDSCNGGGGDNISGLHKHFQRYHLKPDKPRHLPFLEKCRICQHFFIDEDEYTTNHDSNCHTHNPGKRRDAAEAHYRAFCKMVLLYITNQTIKSTGDFLEASNGNTEEHATTAASPQPLSLEPLNPTSISDKLQHQLRPDMALFTLTNSNPWRSGEEEQAQRSSHEPISGQVTSCITIREEQNEEPSVEANKGLAQFPEKTVQPEDLTDTAHDPPTQAGFINPYDSSPAIHISNSPWTPPWNPFNTGFTSSEDRLLPTVSLGSGDSASSYTGVLSGANELLGGFSYFMPSQSQIPLSSAQGPSNLWAVTHASISRSDATTISSAKSSERCLLTPSGSDYLNEWDFVQTRLTSRIHHVLPDGPDDAISLLSDNSTSTPHTLYCYHESCQREFTGKHRRGTLNRHIRLKHRAGQGSIEQERRYICPVEGCGKDYMRQDALLRHQRVKHPELRIPPPVPRKPEAAE